ncbi:DUF1573 domain-containing protein [Candidatus Wolfebacteria bacterium]|nr:DUF1573 domain-containing protein [Candidatus Wolfebacteria bacterium]
MKKETSKLIIYFVAVAAVILLIVWSSANRSGDNSSSVNSPANSSSADFSSAGALTAEESHFDFKTISMANGKVSHRFELKNSGPEPLKIKKVYTSCMCTVALVTNAKGAAYGPFGMPGHGDSSLGANIEINAGESIVVEAVFDPAAHGPQGVGKIKRVVYLDTNSADQPQTQLTFSAEVVK